MASHVKLGFGWLCRQAAHPDHTVYAHNIAVSSVQSAFALYKGTV